MTGSGPVAPDLAGMRVLMEGALSLGGAVGVTIELCLLTLCLPWEAVAIDLERIDWDRGLVPVPARGRARERQLALSSTAMRAILRAAGSAGGKGQAVTAGRGRRLASSDIRLDRVREQLGQASPPTLQVVWNFHGIRVAGASALIGAGVSRLAVSDLLGHSSPVSRGPQDLGSVAERWSKVLPGQAARTSGRR